MMDIDTQIRDYFNATTEPVRIEEILDPGVVIVGPGRSPTERNQSMDTKEQLHPETGPIRRSGLRAAAAAAVLVIAVIAGAVVFSGGGADPDVVVTEPPATTAPPTTAPPTTAPTTTAPASGDPSAEDLIGTWVARAHTWVVTDGSIETLQGGVVFAASTYTATPTTLELVDRSGPMACSSAQPGIYEWAIEDDVLTLTAVSDACDGRSSSLNGITFQRED